ncbi:MAG: hypothetical protein ABR958_05135 [Dehalococcoidales bacterium]|jgi:hypothetical protein
MENIKKKRGRPQKKELLLPYMLQWAESNRKELIEGQKGRKELIPELLTYLKKNQSQVSTTEKTLRKWLPEIIEKIQNPLEEDKPWSTATLDDYPILPEALASVLKVWKFRQGKMPTFTIRDAKWAARFSAIYKDTESLYYCAYQYSGKEKVYKFLGYDFDPAELDNLLASPPFGEYDFRAYIGRAILGNLLRIEVENERFNKAKG